VEENTVMKPLRAAVCLALATTTLVAQADVETLASGLRNPRGLAFASNGALYVAEAGSGGPGPCVPSPSPPPGTQRCYGETAAVTEILPSGGFRRVLTGLPSLVRPEGTAEGGAVDVSFLGTSAYVTMNWGGDPAGRAAAGPKGALFGTQLHMAPSGAYRVVADVSAHESLHNPAGGTVDSNPYGTLAQPGRRVVADAGANALLEVDANGSVNELTVFPALSDGRQSVPTSVVEGPDGALYVGLLTGFPYLRGSASVLRVASDGSSMSTYVGELTAVVDVAFDQGGALYILEAALGHVGPFPPNPGIGIGRLLRMCPGASPAVVLDGLDYASGVAIGPDDAIYLTNHGTSPTAGEVLRLTLDACPPS
jgi:hypothetical protein